MAAYGRHPLVLYIRVLLKKIMEDRFFPIDQLISGSEVSGKKQSGVPIAAYLYNDAMTGLKMRIAGCMQQAL